MYFPHRASRLKLKKIVLASSLAFGALCGGVSVSADETGIGFDSRVVSLDFGMLGKFQIRSDGSVWKHAGMGQWRRLPDLRFDGHNLKFDGQVIGTLTRTDSGVRLVVGDRSVSGNMSVRYQRTEDAQWLRRHAGWYDFGQQGIFRVDANGEVFRLRTWPDYRLMATGTWLTKAGSEAGVVIIDTDGNPVADMVVNGRDVTLRKDGAQVVGAFVAESEIDLADLDAGPLGNTTRIDTATTLHPRVGTYDFGDQGTFLVKPDGKVVALESNGAEQDLGLRMDTLGRVLNTDDQVVGRLIDEGGAPVFESRDGQRVRGKRIEGHFTTPYGRVTTLHGAGVPNGIRIALENVPNGRNIDHLTYYASDFAHPYAGIYHTTDGERYSVARSTGRLWRFNEETRQFEAQPYFVDLSGNIVDLADNQIVGAIKPAAETGRLTEIRFLGNRFLAEWGAPAAGNFADRIRHARKNFGDFVRPALERFGALPASQDGP